MTLSGSSQRAVIPYNSTYDVKSGTHAFYYWSLRDRFTIRSPYSFRAGDVVDVVSVDQESRVVSVVPVLGAEHAPARLVFASNDIPLSAHDEYEVNYAYCTPILVHETVNGGNKVYTSLLAVEGDYAYVRGHSRSGQRFTFSIQSR